FADFSPAGHLSEAFFGYHALDRDVAPMKSTLTSRCPENSLAGERLFRDTFLCQPVGRHYSLLLDHSSRSSRDQGVRQGGGLMPRSPSQVSFFAGEGSWKHNRRRGGRMDRTRRNYPTSPWLSESC